MTGIKKLVFFLLISCFSATSYSQYIQVNDTYTAQQLVENVLINSPCANVSNFSVSGGNFGTGENSFGYFNAGTSSFPFTDGIVLSTCKAVSAIGPNTSTLSEDASGWGADSDLENALGVSNTSNTTTLEFDFIPLTSSISFDYNFASEEYHDTASCTYSDGFVFLLKPVGSSSQYQNLALVPSTTTPVKVTTVHPDIPGGCPAINAIYFDAYNGTSYPTNFNGQTVVMTAKATVVPGTTYHIKLMIADEGNPQYDSAIFLGGGSFNVGTDLGQDRLLSTQNPVCQGETYILDATEGGSTGYKWFKDNIVIPSETNPTLGVIAAGVYKVEITLGTSTCLVTGEVTIEYSSLPVLTSTTIVQCDEDNDGSTLFNLTKVDNIIKNNDSTLSSVVYYETLTAAQNQDSSVAISSPTSYQSSPKTVYASVSNAYGCASTASVDLQIANNAMPVDQPLEICDQDAIDGFYDFTLSDADAPILAGMPAGLVVQYYPTVNDALFDTNQLPNIYRNTTQFIMMIYAKIINGSDCYGIVPVTLYVNSIDPFIVNDASMPLCDGTTQTLSIDPIFTTYLWSNADTDDMTVVSLPGLYSVDVTDANGCQATKTFTVVQTQAPIITSVDINDFQENDNTVLINYTGIGNNEFSLDGVHFQTSPNFTHVAPGIYTVWVKNECGETSEIIYVLGYPKFFTPNGDGFHDIWAIENLNRLPNSNIFIYDRFGKFIYQFNSIQKGWDGTFKSKILPATDYWFVINIENRKSVKGHFTLKR